MEKNENLQDKSEIESESTDKENQENLHQHTSKNLNEDDISILGFSQGGSICWKLGLDFNSKFRRIIPVSSFIHPSYLNNKLEYYKNSLIYSSHGLLDDVIPISLVEEYILELSKNNDLTFEKYNSGHTINQRNLLNLISWLEKTNI